MNRFLSILNLAMLALLAGCTAPATPSAPSAERDQGQAVKARYWEIQRQQQPAAKSNPSSES
jgi:hypothetical protein